MERYAEQLADVPVSELAQLSNDMLERYGIMIPGHRARIMQAVRHLSAGGSAMDVDAGASQAGDDSGEHSVMGSPAPWGIPMPKPPERSVDLSGSLAARAAEMVKLRAKEPEKYNSTSTMYIKSTILKPEIQEVIYCVAIVLHDRITTEEVAGDETPHIEQQHCFPFFSEDNNPLYKVPDRTQDLRRSRQRKVRTVPTEAFIFETIKSVYDCAHFSEECVVISLIYIERLLNTTGVKVLTSTWRPIVLAAIIVAQKVFDDRCLSNYEFSVYCPMFTLKEINHLENKFLEMLCYNVSISASTYASFYFHIQTLCRHAQTERTPLNMELARQIEAKVWSRSRNFASPSERKTRSDHEPFRLGRLPAVMN